MVFHWRLSDGKFPQISRTLLSILANLNNTAVWMVSTRSLISKSSSLCTNPLVTVLSASVTIGITVTFMFSSFFGSLAKSEYLSLALLSFSFTLWSAIMVKSTFWEGFFLTITRSGHLVKIRWSVCILTSQRRFSHSPGQILGCAYTIYSYGQILISCIIPSGSPSHISSYTLFVLICCIHLLWDRLFCIYHHITYICYFVASYLIWLLYNWSLWRCFVLLLEEIHFLF